ncbi:hypothetical protein [Acetobacter okinawensis]|uniref:hypothetical protein n=1 Tax=Acetobacter okinawensis TaxID=1076594 RepID=UPI0020A06007|nr:hypothetical protein [Acetobacter okinawensis]MCP1214280.1 hypothetical protein [Acetobacter okinawensis]
MDKTSKLLRQQAIAQITHRLAQELTTPVAPEVTLFVEQMLGPVRPLGVLFYGSGLRSGIDEDTLLDFYIIVRRQADWPRSVLACMANAVLPPNVEYYELQVAGRVMRAKVAILTLAQLHALTGVASLNTTVWARFSQPVRLVWHNDVQAEQAITHCIVRANVTAARWAALLGPRKASPVAFWNALYARTYRAELRVENGQRSSGLVEANLERYEHLLLPCWQAAGIQFDVQADQVMPDFPDRQRHEAQRQWGLRARLGRPLNILRLIKAVYTFKGSASYAAWKVRRHSGIEITLSPFAHKHPLLAAPPVLWKLWRQGAFRQS